MRRVSSQCLAFGRSDPEAWRPERLEYGVEALAATPTGEAAVLSAYPGQDGEFDWHAFDLQPGSVEAPPLPAEDPVSFRLSVLPTHVRFRGMPNPRWWEFESSTTDFGEIKPDKSDLARLIVMDFMLIHGVGWFVVPLELEVGSLCRVDSLVVHDVFGDRTLVERADTELGGLGERWTIFSTSVASDPAGLADFFILPPSASTAIQTGPHLEEVGFVRDEMANRV